MSTTYSIGCRRCREKLWIGQTSGVGPLRLYDGAEGERFASFLMKHAGHELVFEADSDEGELAGYEDAAEK